MLFKVFLDTRYKYVHPGGDSAGTVGVDYVLGEAGVVAEYIKHICPHEHEGASSDGLDSGRIESPAESDNGNGVRARGVVPGVVRGSGDIGAGGVSPRCGDKDGVEAGSRGSGVVRISVGHIAGICVGPGVVCGGDVGVGHAADGVGVGAGVYGVPSNEGRRGSRGRDRGRGRGRGRDRGQFSALGIAEGCAVIGPMSSPFHGRGCRRDQVSTVENDGGFSSDDSASNSGSDDGYIDSVIVPSDCDGQLSDNTAQDEDESVNEIEPV
ncbi:unnamed protein product [Phytophthora fragariaefolia]|uniref:Unnamed protein product n=1 Tax=Phytophthora fragariaefolia TaxID=1490495 RepID=A0A9W6XVX2_9STRA|nr:unnamed protein product [Phytophthora fragariaefolia]